MFDFTRLPYWYLLIFLIILSGFAEGIGMSALVPILTTISSETDTLSNSFPFNIIPKVFLFFEIEPSFLNLLGSCVSLVALTFLIIFFQEKLLFKSKYKFLNEIRMTSLNKLFSSNWSFLSKKNSGDISNILIHEAERGSDGITAFVTMIALGFQLLVYLIFTFLLSWQMTLISLIAISVSSIVAIYLIRSIRSVAEQGVQVDTFYNRFIVETIRGSKLLKSTATSDTYLKKVNAMGLDVTSIKNQILLSQSKLKLILQIIILISMAFILYVGIELLDIPINTLFIFVFILLRLTPKTFTFHAQYHNYVAFKPALNIVDQLIYEANLEFEKEGKTKGNKLALVNEIIFNKVFYKYKKDSNFVLKNIDMKIPCNKIIGIAGKSGSGKTTFIDIILGLLKPSEGFVKIDGINLNKININQYRKKISYVTQDSIFFDGTLKDNIILGQNKINKNELKKCIKAAQVDKVINDLPNGLDTLISEAGSNLSGGQKQRIAIARALYRKPKLLILDEATSALDNEVESKFRYALKKHCKDITVIIISHKLINLKYADLILVFEKGQIVQNGKFIDLQNSSGVFSHLLKIEDKKRKN